MLESSRAVAAVCLFFAVVLVLSVLAIASPAGAAAQEVSLTSSVPDTARAERLAALRRAHERAPHDSETALRLIQALSREDGVEVPLRGAELDEVIALSRRLEAAGAILGERFYQLLVAADRPEEVVAAFEDGPRAPWQWSVYLAAKSLQGEAREAVREARNGFEDPELLARSAASALEVVQTLGRHRSVRPLWVGSDLLLRFLDARLEGDDAAAAAVFLPGSEGEAERLVEILSSWTLDLALPALPEVERDQIATLIGTVTEGDPSIGCWIALHPQYGTDPLDSQPIHLAVRDDGLRVATVSEEIGVLAAESRRFLDRGQLDGARWWARQAAQAVRLSGGSGLAVRLEEQITGATAAELAEILTSIEAQAPAPSRE
jgi:hypothetical protein